MRKFSSKASKKMRNHLNAIRNITAAQIACDETKAQIIKEKINPCNAMLFTFSVLISGNSFSSSTEFCSYLGVDTPSEKTFYQCQKKISICVTRLIRKKMSAYQREVLSRKKKFIERSAKIYLPKVFT